MPIKSYICINKFLILCDQVNKTFFSLELNFDHISTMSFSSKRAVYYLIDQLHYCLLLRLIKTSVILKHQQFKDGQSDQTKSSVLKRQQLYIYNNKKRQELSKYESESDNKRYVFFPFIANLLPSQIELNRSTKLSKKTKSLNHFVYILKICCSEKY